MWSWTENKCAWHDSRPRNSNGMSMRMMEGRDSRYDEDQLEYNSEKRGCQHRFREAEKKYQRRLKELFKVRYDLAKLQDRWHCFCALFTVMIL